MGVLNLPGSPPTIEFGFEQAKEFILEPFYNDPMLTAFHTIDQDLVGKTQIAFLGQFGLSGKKDTGCGFESDGSLPTSEKFWNPEPIRGGWEQCWNDLYPSLLIYAQQAGVDKKDMLQNAIWMSFIMDRMMDAIMKNYLRRVWFNDTAITAPDLTAGTDPDYFNVYDGLWKQIFAAVTAGDTYRYTITENAAASKAAQLALASDRAYLALQALYNNADSRLMGRNDLVYVSTRSLVNNYADYLEGQDNFVSFERIEGGYRTLQYRGIPIIENENWDRTIRAYFDDGTVYDNPHRMILTTRENLRLGLDSSQSLQNVRSWYEEKDEVVYSKYATMEDTKLIFEFMTAAAY